MSLKVKVKLDNGRIRDLSSATKKAISMTAEQLRTELIQEQVMPYREGILQNANTYIDEKAIGRGEVQIVHDSPYAARLYFHPEYNFNQEINARARGEWWEPWISGTKRNRPAQLFRTFYRQVTGVD